METRCLLMAFAVPFVPCAGDEQSVRVFVNGEEDSPARAVLAGWRPGQARPGRLEGTGQARLAQITMLCRCPSFLRKNVIPVQTGAGIQTPGSPASGCRLTSGMTQACEHGYNVA